MLVLDLGRRRARAGGNWDRVQRHHCGVDRRGNNIPSRALGILIIFMVASLSICACALNALISHSDSTVQSARRGRVFHTFS